MDKYAVVLDDEKTKTAGDADHSTCPICGGRVTQGSEEAIPFCDNCGTKPFEKKPGQ
jgi:ribosomal protein L37AE/L43A